MDYVSKCDYMMCVCVCVFYYFSYYMMMLPFPSISSKIEMLFFDIIEYSYQQPRNDKRNGDYNDLIPN
jgi:hypothetical protein